MASVEFKNEPRPPRSRECTPSGDMATDTAKHCVALAVVVVAMVVVAMAETVVKSANVEVTATKVVNETEVVTFRLRNFVSSQGPVQNIDFRIPNGTSSLVPFFCAMFLALGGSGHKERSRILRQNEIMRNLTQRRGFYCCWSEERK